MLYRAATLAVMSLCLAGPISASDLSALLPVAGAQTIAHDAGCFRTSPDGQCCHAGPSRYHCHS